MPGYYKKRKRNVGPNKNEEKVSRSKQSEGLGGLTNSLGARYPSVARLTVRLQFLSPQQHLLGEETRVFNPQDGCDFSAPCPGRCGVGDFDLAAKISSIVSSGQAVSESNGVCQERLFAGSSDICDCRLQCHMEVAYQAAPDAATRL